MFLLSNLIGGKPMAFERRNFGSREMHKAICADCGRETEVPFKPQEGRPVYCRECYQKHRPKRF
jgi:CxxC-x17-CxxC domain-containing protein